MGNAAFKLDATLVPEECCNCGITFAVPENWRRGKKDSHGYIYCPNGHSYHYPGESVQEKLTRRLELEKNRRLAAEKETKRQERLKNQHINEAKKLKERVKHGVCPCCNRTFKQLAAHMKRKHPGFSDN